MKRTKYTAEFKEETVKQVIDRDHTVDDVAKRIGITEGVFTHGSASSRKRINPNPTTSKRCKPRWSNSKLNCDEQSRSATA
jgi:transposase-like protein